METKQVIVIRKDLNMRKGKMIAQGAHASMKVFFDRALDAGESMHIKLTEAMHEWAFGIFTKVVVGVESEEELFDIYDKTKLFGLPCAIIQDVGATEFNGVPTYTALAVGPAESEKIDKITGNLKLL